jgi:Mg-chelatase subunit ChlI
MNDEEGELRPQIVDRIGLQLTVEPVSDTEPRAEIMRRREAFTRDPEQFLDTWSTSQSELAQEVADAERLLPSVRVSDRLYSGIVRLVLASGVSSHRADITILECAKATAALAGRSDVANEDVLEAAGLALGHRLAVDPFGPPNELEPRVLRRLLDEALEPELTPKKAAG